MHRFQAFHTFHMGWKFFQVSNRLVSIINGTTNATSAIVITARFHLLHKIVHDAVTLPLAFPPFLAGRFILFAARLFRFFVLAAAALLVLVLALKFENNYFNILTQI